MSRSRTILRVTVRRLIGLGVLVGICAVVLPLPVTILVPSDPVSEKDLSQPFPCMNRPCGCRSAEQCWKQCCCFTNVQKVAWAKANHVQIPDFVVVAAEKESSAEKPCCCSTKSKTDAVSKPDETVIGVAGTCCSDRNTKCPTAPSVKSSRTAASSSAKTPGRIKWVLAVKAAECQGQSGFWLTLPPAVIPTWPQLPPELPTIAESRHAVSERLPLISLDAPNPPPKIG